MSDVPDPPQPPQGTARQWEAHVRRMVRQGRGREEIIYEMTSSNWPYPEAQAMIRRIASSERWQALGILIGGAAAAAAFGAASFIALTSPQGGVVWHGPCIFSAALFIYGLVRLARIRV